MESIFWAFENKFQGIFGAVRVNFMCVVGKELSSCILRMKWSVNGTGIFGMIIFLDNVHKFTCNTCKGVSFWLTCDSWKKHCSHCQHFVDYQ